MSSNASMENNSADPKDPGSISVAETASNSSDYQSGSDSDSEESDDDTPTQFRSASEKADHEKSLSAEYRQINHKMLNQRAQVARTGGLDVVQENITKLGTLFNLTRKTAALNKNIQTSDAKSLASVSDLAEISIRNMKIGQSTNHIDLDSFLRNTKKFLLGDRGQELENAEDADGERDISKFNFLSLGAKYLALGKTAPTIDFLKGPLTIEKKQRVFKKRAQNDLPSSGLTTADTPDLESTAAKGDDTAIEVMNVFKTLQRQQKGEPINVYKFFINPNSFGQSVENMFYISFLVRDGKVTLTKNPESDSWDLREVPPGSEYSRLVQDSNVTHNIFRLDFPRWKNYTKEFNITSSCLADRGY